MKYICMALVVGTTITFTTNSRADQCSAVPRGLAQKATTILTPGRIVVEHCEPCQSTRPGTPFSIATVSIDPDDTSETTEIKINGKSVDLAYLFVKSDSGQFDNVARLVGCETHDVSPTLEIALQPKSVVIEIGTLRVTAMRPGTDRPWDTVIEGRKTDFCDTINAASNIPGVGAIGNGLSSVCRFFEGDKPTRIEKRDPHMPDVFVRIKTSGRTSNAYRTNTVQDIFEYDFQSSFLVPLEAVGASGLQIQVVNDDGSANPNDLIGSLVLSRKQILHAVKESEPLIVKDGGIDKMVISITGRSGHSDDRLVLFNVADGLGRVPNLEVFAGQVVDICVLDAYQLKSPRSAWLPPTGFPGYLFGDVRERRLPRVNADFGSAVAIVGNPTISEFFTVGHCGSTLAQTSGPIHVGINDNKPSENEGSLRFIIRISDPTVEEWRSMITKRQTAAMLREAPTGHLTLRSEPPGATLFIDGREYSPSMPLIAGKHAIWAYWPDGRVSSYSHDVVAGVSSTVGITPPDL